MTVQVHGETFISKAGITSATFATVAGRAVLELRTDVPERQYSALTANGNLCKCKLTMPTEMVGQNGVEIHQSTKIAVTGCPKKATHRKRKKGKGRHSAATR